MESELRPRIRTALHCAYRGLAVLAILTLLSAACAPAPAPTPTAAPKPAATATPAVAATPTPAAKPTAPVATPAPTAAPKPAAGAPVTGAPPVPKPSQPLIDQVTVDLAANPQSMHPYLVSQIDGWSVVQHVFNYLVERDPDGKLVPALAESFSFPDDRTIEFKLRRGVKFHNGEDFNADSVAFSLEHLRLPELKSPFVQNYEVIERVERVDDFTVRFHLKQPTPFLLDAMAQQFALLPPRYTREVGPNGFAQRPVGTGPYRFVEFIPDDRVVLEANDQYWGGLPKGWALARRIVFRPVPEPATRVADLRTGTANLARAIPENDAQAIEAERGRLKVARANVPRVTFVLFNTQTGAIKDQRARQALNHAVNKEAIVRAIQGGHGEILGSPFTSVTVGKNPGVRPYPYDPQRARQLLQQAGLTGPINVTLEYATLENRELIEAVAGNLREVGVNATIQGFELAVFNENWRNKRVGDLRFASWGPVFDPWSLLQFLVHSKGLLSTFSNAELDRLIEQANSTMDIAQRGQILQQIEQRMHDDPWAIYLFSLTAVYGFDDKLPAFKARPDDLILLTQGSGR